MNDFVAQHPKLARLLSNAGNIAGGAVAQELHPRRLSQLLTCQLWLQQGHKAG